MRDTTKPRPPPAYEESEEPAYDDDTACQQNTSVQPSDQEKGEKGVTVSSLVNERFDKWDEFLPSLKKTYVKRTSTSRDARNRSVQARYSAGGDPTPERELFQDETFPYYLISYESCSVNRLSCKD
ncbi:hypothetical protein PI126_g18142 [Phytophthora idaei]|nr:hypothetical protein PI126_g18142 [Phytophthora idaei]